MEDFSGAMKSVPHIYLSALAWLPRDSWAKKNIANIFGNSPLIGGISEDWEWGEWTKDIGVQLACLAYSPDGTQIAAACASGITLWDSRTGSSIYIPPLLRAGNNRDSERRRPPYIIKGSSVSACSSWQIKFLVPRYMFLLLRAARNT